MFDEYSDKGKVAVIFFIVIQKVYGDLWW